MRYLAVEEIKEVSGAGDVEMEYYVQIGDTEEEGIKTLSVFLAFTGTQEDILEAVSAVFV